MKIKIISSFLIVALALQLTFPLGAWALTGGPSQPEVESFEPVDTSEMVDHFTGDFTYNIPLLDVDGYPINIAYNSNITMDQEASIVGLGWNINPGVINRGMRGIPDDFKQDIISKEFNIRENFTAGLKVGGSVEIFGWNGVRIGTQAGIKYNNYRGIGFDFGITPTYSLKMGSQSANQSAMSVKVGLGLTSSSQDGSGFNPSLSVAIEHSKALAPNEDGYDTESRGGAFSFGASYSSRTGLKQMTFTAEATHTKNKLDTYEDENGNEVEYTSESDAANSPGTGTPLTASFNFAAPSFSPAPGNPMVTYGANLRASFSAAIKGLHPAAFGNGYFSRTYLETKKVDKPAYGYFYAQDAPGNDVLLDLNREKDVPYLPGIRNLPVTQFTFDSYNVAGQGVGGVYRPYRSDVGLLHDCSVQNRSTNGDLGAELGIGIDGDFHIGTNFESAFSDARTGNWTYREGNRLAATTGFTGKQINNSTYLPLYEPYYLKQGGDLIATDPEEQAFYNQFGGKDPVRVKLSSPRSNTATLVRDDGNNIALTPGNTFRKKREKRNQMISLYTAEEAQALFGPIRYFTREVKTENTSSRLVYSSPKNLSRVDDTRRKAHHTSAIVVTRPDGVRYVYGIAAYNTKQDEYTFNCDRVGTNGNIPKTTSQYELSEVSTNNEKGLNHAYNKQSIPPYAHSYLLTGVFSPDYVDLTGDGPSNDDLGTYHVIDYWKHTDNYCWRTPYQDANFDVGTEANYADNRDAVQNSKASFVYGEKELWYVKSISSKAHTAEFLYNDPVKDSQNQLRKDNWGVQNGGWLKGGLGTPTGAKPNNNSSTPYLLGINLDAINNVIQPHEYQQVVQRNQLKQVWFEYDYSLCKGLPNSSGSNINNDNGKLTLKKLYFTYCDEAGDFAVTDLMKTKGKSTAYHFHYDNPNPSYSLECYDKWGFYKPVQGPSNAEFPHVIQDKNQANLNARCWSLSSIDLPTGGKIKVELESDDYAFVQDKSTMQLIEVAGFSMDKNAFVGAPDRLYAGMTLPHPYLIVKLPNTVSNVQEFRNKYVRDIKWLYFDFKVKINASDQSFNTVKGYAEIDPNPDEFGFFTFDGQKYGSIKTRTPDTRIHTATIVPVNPIAREAWNMSRLNCPHLVYDGYNTSGDPLGVILGLLTLIPNLAKAFDGAFTDFVMNGYASQFKPERSWVRLYCPNKTKYGGGSRVKNILIEDNWNNMAVSGQSASYGHSFDYSLSENETTYSSGVASYEPLIGNEENPWRQPIFYGETVPLGEKFNHYLETPMGEAFFPGPSIGYSRIKVSSFYQDANTPRTPLPAGYSVYEYYTARDFPTIVRETEVEELRDKPSVVEQVFSSLFAQFGSDTYDYMAASQGYSVELNDMHGKPKSQLRYRHGEDNPYSGVEYTYQTENNRLDNQCIVAHPDGTIDTREVGIDIETVGDARADITRVSTPGVQFNLEGISIWVAIIPIPIPYPTYSSEEIEFRSCVITKVINRYGVLKQTRAWQEGASVLTENLVRDAETGEMIVARTQNEFGDWIYNYTQPAHWVYEAMGQAYRNEGAELTNLKINGQSQIVMNDNSLPSLTQLGGNNFFLPGDELLARNGSNFQSLWVIRSETVNNQAQVSVIDRNGQPLAGQSFSSLKIVRSARRNQQSQAVGTLTSLNQPYAPIPNQPGKYSWQLNTDTWVTEAGAVEFDDQWSVPCCGLGTDCILPCEKVNPYHKGMRGNWRSKRNHAYLTERRLDPNNLQRNVRYGGTFQEFQPFWKLENNRWVKNDQLSHWQRVSESVKYNQNGVEIENKDALDRYSAAVYGYSNRFPVAVATNAALSQIAFESFEDHTLVEGNSATCFLRPHSANVYKGKRNAYDRLVFDSWSINKTKFTHSGITALQTPAGEPYHLDYRLFEAPTPGTTLLQQEQGTNAFIFKTDSINDCLPLFSPPLPPANGSQKYVVSVWTSVTEACSTINANPGQYGFASKLEVKLLNGCNAIPSENCQWSFAPAGPIIDGWQRIEGVVELKAGCATTPVIGLRISLVPPEGTRAIFDDLRIHPFNATMKSFVYDPTTLRLVAELDENNYATFYEYDSEGKLVRKKRETEKGIVTLQENRRSLFKKSTE